MRLLYVQNEFAWHHTLRLVGMDRTSTKLQIVYDTSSKTSGPSLNECLYRGSKFNQLVLELLIQSWSYKIALIANLEKEFLMIAVDKKDRDILCFLWGMIFRRKSQSCMSTGLPEWYLVYP